MKIGMDNHFFSGLKLIPFTYYENPNSPNLRSTLESILGSAKNQTDKKD